MDATSYTERRPAQPTAQAADPRARTRVLVLGPLQIDHGGRAVHVAGTHRRRLLALLASRCGQVVGTDAIIDALWGDDPPPSATKTIQSHVARLRASLAGVGRELIETTPAGYRLAGTNTGTNTNTGTGTSTNTDTGTSSGVEVDADTFERTAAEGHRRLEARDLTGAAALLEDALALWRGPPFADFPDADFAVHERTRLTELHATAVEDLAEVRLEAGAATVVTAELERLVAADPGRERAWGLLMRALYASGRQQDALVAYQRARRALAEHFGLEPGPELRALERRVLDQDPDLAVAPRDTIPAALRPRSGDPVGRAAERAWLIEAWGAVRRGRGQLRIVLGATDSGRTRLVSGVASAAAADHAAITYLQGADGVLGLVDRDRLTAADPETDTDTGTRTRTAAVVDAVTERSRLRPQLIVIDDVEWASGPTMETLRVLVDAVERLPVLLVLIADPAGGGPAVQALARLDPAHGVTTTLGPLSDEELAGIVAADGIDDPAAVAAIVSVAAGRPGVARREAAAWAERAAGDRLHQAAARSAGALAAADEARGSVVEEVARLVRARARRHELTTAAWIGRQPYRGLAAYGPADADVFVGREHLVAELATRVLDRRLVVVTGASGSGKSSLIRAGLVPLVESGHLPGHGPWRVNVMVPGPHPRRALDALDGLDERGPQLLVVDQFEECFQAPPAATDSFVARLLDLALDPALDAHLVLIVRADRYGGLTELRGLRGLLDGAQVTVGRPSEDELRRIVEEPAARAGCRVEPLLVATLLDDVGGTDGTLPLVSTTLAELWEHRDGDTLTAERYLELGGLAASIERLGERILAAGDHGRPLDEDTARRALLLLTDITDDGDWMRRRLHADEVPAPCRGTIDAFVDGRLVVRDDDVVEIAHEVVFRAWPRLQGWLEAARQDLVLGRDVRAAARAWEEQGRSHDDVYRGARLELATEWAERQPDAVPPIVAEFVAAGRAEADRARLDAEVQLARERKAGRRLRRALVAASLLLVLALVATVTALASRQRVGEERDRANAAADRADAAADQADAAAAEAHEAADVAETREEEARAAQDAEAQARDEADAERDAARIARLVAESGQAIDQRLDLALLLAIEAHRRDPSVATRGALLTALTQGRSDPDATAPLGDPVASSVLSLVPTGLARTFTVAVSADGSAVVLTGDADPNRLSRTIVVIDLGTGIERWRITNAVHNTEPFISADGSFVLVTSDYTVAVYDRDGARRVVAELPADGPAILESSLSPDGSTVGAILTDGTIRFLDVATGAPAGTEPPSPGAVGGRFGPDGTFAYGVFLGADQESGLEIRRWDHRAGVERGRVELEPAPGGGYPLGFTFSPDLALLVGVAHRDEDWVDVWDATNGQIVGDRVDRPRLARGIPAFVTDRVIAIGRSDGRLALYDLEAERNIRAPIETSGGGIWDVAATPDGSVLVSAGDDSSLRLWGPDDCGPLETPLVPGGDLTAVSADRSRFVVRMPDGTFGVHPTDDGSEPPVIITPPEDLGSIGGGWPTISADGTRVAVWVDGPVPQAYAADATTGAILWRSPPGRFAQGATISPDGRSVVYQDVDADTLLRVDVESGEVLATLSQEGMTDEPVPFEMHATADGRYLLLNLFDHLVRLDLLTLAVVESVPTPFGVQGDAAELPGTDRFLAAGVRGRVAEVDMATGATRIGQSLEITSLTGAAVSPDGSLVASAHAFASSVALFDGATLLPIGEPIPAADGPRPARFWFTADGDLVGTSRFGVSRWELDPAEWERIACATAGRNLSRTEWIKHLGDEPYRPACPDRPIPAD